MEKIYTINKKNVKEVTDDIFYEIEKEQMDKMKDENFEVVGVFDPSNEKEIDKAMNNLFDEWEEDGAFKPE